jgi:adenylylsulfate reductase subunit A
LLVAEWLELVLLLKLGTGGRDMKIICVEKANIDRSGAVAQGLYAINCYMGMQWGENQPEDHVRYARNDLMGMVREDLGYDMARHVDSTVHMFDEWGSTNDEE